MQSRRALLVIDARQSTPRLMPDHAWWTDTTWIYPRGGAAAPRDQGGQETSISRSPSGSGRGVGSAHGSVRTFESGEGLQKALGTSERRRLTTWALPPSV